MIADMDAGDIVMLVGLGVAALIVGAWLVTVFRMRRGPGLRQENPAQMDSRWHPWSNNGGRW